jgi:hypothetical protein
MHAVDAVCIRCSITCASGVADIFKSVRAFTSSRYSPIAHSANYHALYLLLLLLLLLLL